VAQLVRRKSLIRVGAFQQCVVQGISGLLFPCRVVVRRRQQRTTQPDVGRVPCDLCGGSPLPLDAVSSCHHTRPFLDPTIPLNIVEPRWILDWDRRGSFPSDTATLFFALATVIFLENRLVGLFCLLWVVVIIAVPRVIFGWHYPTDIVGSLVLGLTCVLLFNAVAYLRTLFGRTLILYENQMYIVHALVFIFLMEAFETFLSLQKLGKIH
jgi:hypothetical protein